MKQKSTFFLFPSCFAVSAIFLSNGIAVASWATRIPAIQDKLNLSPDALGIALFGSPVCAVLIMPFIGSLVARYVSQLITRCTSFAMCLVLPLTAPAPSLLWLTIATGLLGNAQMRWISQ